MLGMCGIVQLKGGAAAQAGPARVAHGALCCTCLVPFLSKVRGLVEGAGKTGLFTWRFTWFSSSLSKKAIDRAVLRLFCTMCREQTPLTEPSPAALVEGNFAGRKHIQAVYRLSVL